MPLTRRIITDSTLDVESTDTGYMYTAFAVIIFYDHLLYLDQEVSLFWRKKLFTSSVIFILNRYFLLVYGVICLLQIPLWTTAMGCEATNLALYITNIILFVVTAMFSALRVYAISSGDKAIAFAVLIIGIIPAIINLYTTVQQSYAYVGVDGFCSRTRFYTIEAANTLDVVACACAVLSDLIVIIITWCRTYGLWRHTSRGKTAATSLVNLVLGGGTLYFLTLLLVNVLELVITRSWVNSSSASVAYTSYMLVPISSVLISHFIIDLQQTSSKDTTTLEPRCGSRTTSQGNDGPILTSVVGDMSAGVFSMILLEGADDGFSPA